MGKKPVFSYGNRLVISEKEMKLGQRYEVEFLGVKMVAIKTGNCVDLYQIIDGDIEIDAVGGKG